MESRYGISMISGSLPKSFRIRFFSVKLYAIRISRLLNCYV